MRQGGKRLLIVALALCACARGAFAQNGLRDRERQFSASQEIASDLRKAHFHHGPFYLLSTFQLSDIGYDSSFYVPTADRQSGFRFGVQAPTRFYIVPSKKTIYSIDVRPEWSFFNRGGNFRPARDANCLASRGSGRKRAVDAVCGQRRGAVFFSGKFRYISGAAIAIIGLRPATERATGHQHQKQVKVPDRHHPSS